jgi:hypothetical protein
VLGQDGALAGVGRADADDHGHPSAGLVEDDLGQPQPLLTRHPGRLARLAHGCEAMRAFGVDQPAD